MTELQPSYFDYDTRSVVNLSDMRPYSTPDHVQPGFEVNRVNTPAEHRGKGHARGLMQQVLADADADQVALQLFVLPTGPMDYVALAKWYVRLGFSKQGNQLWVRWTTLSGIALAKV